MKPFLENIEKYFSSLHMHSVSYERDGIRPAHDWLTLLAVALATVCIAAVAAYYVYHKIDTGTLFAVPTDTKADTRVVIDAKLLQEAVDRLNAKQAARASLYQDAVVPADPSL